MSQDNLIIRFEIRTKDGMAYCDGEIDRQLVDLTAALHPSHTAEFISREILPWVVAAAQRWFQETLEVKR